MSTRTIAAIWYFFTLIMISSYTANLAAFLTVEKVFYPIEDAESLAAQTKIEYGCLKSGSTKSFFNESVTPLYKRMWEFMSSRPHVFMENKKDGIEKVRKSNGLYAYLMESASIKYTIERDCNLTKIGNPLDSKGYGIATRKGKKCNVLMIQFIRFLLTNHDRFAVPRFLVKWDTKVAWRWYFAEFGRSLVETKERWWSVLRRN